MIGECKNCGAKLQFDPLTGKLNCDMCGSSFDAEEDIYSEESKKLLENKKVVESDKTMDMNIYSCSACGADIILTSTEASTKCVYCGNPNIVFSRISKQQKPDGILPFKISKEQAVQAIRDKIGKGFFVPKEIKNFKIDSVRGIYIPYWFINVDFRDNVLLQSTHGSGKHKRTYNYIRCGSTKFSNIPVDASNKLSDDSSIKLEPFYYDDIRDFDVNYLTGFYSDICDTPLGNAKQTATNRAREMFLEETMKSIGGHSKKVLKDFPNYAINEEPLYVMLPAWFLTFFYKGEVHTILVNGQTGKVVGAVPWDKAKVTASIAGIGAAITAAASPIYYGLINSSAHHTGSKDGAGKLVFYGIFFTIVAFIAGVSKFNKVKKNVKLTQSKMTYSYVKKRQE